MLLRLDDVHAYYGFSHVLQGVTLELNEGEIVCLLGRNGVGKTTTLRSIMGLVAVRGGSIALDGSGLVGLPTHRIARRGVAYVPEERRILGQLTVAENLAIGARPAGDGNGHGGWDAEQVYALFPRLAERRGQLGGTLSGGEQQMLAIGRALMGNPRLLLLDEPSQGLAPRIVRLVEDVVRRIRARGVSILLVEQNVRSARELGDRHYILPKGRVVREATSSELESDHALTRTYLGV
jgi:branched-chain amino acid transport system ATP-binding protein